MIASRYGITEYMTQELPFAKMHGLGNDFVVIDDLAKKATANLTLPLGGEAELAKRICDRRFGVGADQVLWLKPAHDPALDVRMEILNSDGSVAEMCGNGIRAVALYLHRHGSNKKLKYGVETLAGIQTVELVGNGESNQVRVNMGKPVLGGGFPGSGEALQIKGQDFRFYEVSMGNPHAVIFVESVGSFPLEELGPLIEKNPRFPARTNVEVVEMTGSHSIKIRVWERGAGATLACGTGACAAAVAALALKKVKTPLEVWLPGGCLKIEWAGGVGNAQPVFMQGPATEVFEGKYLL